MVLFTLPMDTLQVLSLNCHGFNNGTAAYVQLACTRYNVDILFLQETWLSDANSHIIGNSLPDYVVTHTSAMERKIVSGLLVGRPFGGTAVLIHRKLARYCSAVFSCNPRITAVRCELPESNDLVLGSVYFPYDSGSIDYIIELEDTVGCLQGIMDKYSNSQFIFGGDFNMSKLPGNSNQEIVSKLCSDNLLTWLHHDASTGSYTFHNDTAGKYSLIDHFISSVTLVPLNGVVSILVEDDNLSDHFAIFSHFVIRPTSTQTAASDPKSNRSKRLDWKGADIHCYQSGLSNLLSLSRYQSMPCYVKTLYVKTILKA